MVAAVAAEVTAAIVATTVKEVVTVAVAAAAESAQARFRDMAAVFINMALGGKKKLAQPPNSDTRFDL